MFRGHLYGVGVGPGDPELMTLKAVRCLEECEICFCPGRIPEETVAYQIAVQAVKSLKDKPLVGLELPMTKDAVRLERSHKKAVETVKAALAAGKTAVFLALGDISLYATFSYLAEPLEAAGYEVTRIPGIPSFIAAAAKGRIALASQDEEVHIIPATYKKDFPGDYPGTTVYMKAGKKMRQIKEMAEEKTLLFAENIGMKEEKIEFQKENMPDAAGYYTLVIKK